MKKFYFLTLLIFSATVSKAQFGQQGQKVVANTFGFNASNINNSNTQTNSVKQRFLNTQLSIGKFLKPNVLTNFYLGFSTFKQHSAVILRTNNYNAGFQKIYYKELFKKLYFGIGGRLGANYITSRSNPDLPQNKIETDSYGADFSIFPTLSYQLTNRFLANLTPSGSFVSANYNYGKTKIFDATSNSTSESSTSSFGISTSIFNSPLQNLSIGFSYLLKRK